MTGGAKVNDLDPVGEPHRVSQHDILRLEVSVDELQVLQLQQRGKDLLRDGTDVLQWQWLELVLLEEIIEVLFQHLEHEARVVLMLETFVRPHKVELVGVLMAEAGEDADLNLALASVRGMVLEDLDGHDFIRALLPALDHLPEGAPSEELEHLVGIGHRIEHLMLDQLVIPLASRGGGGFGVGRRGDSLRFAAGDKVGEGRWGLQLGGSGSRRGTKLSS